MVQDFKKDQRKLGRRKNSRCGKSKYTKKKKKKKGTGNVEPKEENTRSELESPLQLTKGCKQTDIRLNLYFFKGQN